MSRDRTDRFRRVGVACAALLSLLSATLASAPAGAETGLRVVMHADVKILDPIWTTVYITRNHGYMIYDTLFAMDAKGEIKPQMIDKYSVSADNLVIRLSDDEATVRFRQSYDSANLKSAATKTLVLVHRDGRWRIQQERVGG